MDMHSREQYLERLQEEYRHANKKQRGRLLDEARKRTRLNRKVLIRKLAHPALPKIKRKRRRRRPTYDAAVIQALVKIWEIFDYPCEQRLGPTAENGQLGSLPTQST
jgi:hypothetical protein